MNDVLDGDNEDREMEYLFLLESYASMSLCKDKHVAALSVVKNTITGISINRCFDCNSKCDHSCHPRHAEQGLNLPTGCTVYINLYPCPDCQIYMRDNFVKEVVVFGTQHKENLNILPIRCIDVPFDFLKKYNTEAEQQRVAAGEAAELIAALMDAQRVDTKEHYPDIHDEMVDMFIQLFLLKEPIRADWEKKIDKLIGKFQRGGFDVNSRPRP